MPLAMFTGGSSWFVREAARSLLADGWRIALSDVNMDTLSENVAAIGGGDAVSAERLDVTDLAAGNAYVGKLVRDRGAIDALVNVAGGTQYLKLPSRPPFHETDPAQWDRILGPNLYGTMHCCHAVIPHMVKARSGVIVNFSSSMGLRGKANWALYSLAKGAIIRFSQSLCEELGPHGIRVNSIAPGSAQSRWVPDTMPVKGQVLPAIGERITARDIGDAISFLLSDRARHITGICLDLSGGAAMH